MYIMQAANYDNITGVSIMLYKVSSLTRKMI